MYSLIDAISGLFGKRQQNSRVSVLCLLGEEHDQSVIRRLCQGSGWNVSFAADLDAAQRLRARGIFQVVLLDRDVAGDNWRQALSRLAPSCTLLVSKVSDDNLWNEVVRHGGYDVLAKPLKDGEVTRAVRLAWSFWMSAHGRPVI